jgi:hypothetical protein
MKTSIEIVNCELNGPFFIEVMVENDGKVELSVPVARLESVAELAALDLRDSKGANIDPVEYLMVNSAHEFSDLIIAPGKIYAFFIKGKLIEKFGSLALVFPKATYLVDRGEQYSLALRWGDFESNAVQFAL